ncbi:MAG: hypothetical protein LBR26_06970 [Prevotella sp.]|jgi:hypothetical protein|nr:hypothetical protein [Prevotella sp.]
MKELRYSTKAKKDLKKYRNDACKSDIRKFYTATRRLIQKRDCPFETVSFLISS